MWVTIYVASMAVLLLACSVWAMREKDRGAQTAFAVGAGLLGCLLITLLGSGCSSGERAIFWVVVGFILVAVLLFCRAFVCTFNVNR